MTELANQPPNCKRNIAPLPTGSPLDPNWMPLGEAVSLVIEKAATAHVKRGGGK